MRSWIWILFVIAAFSCKNQYSLTESTSNNITISDSLSSNSETVSVYSPYKEKMDQLMNEVVVTCDTFMTVGNPQGLLGNWVCDLVLQTTREEIIPGSSIDTNAGIFVILNNGGLRTTLSKGEITLGKLYELMPFENELVLVTMQGKDLQLIIDYISKQMQVEGRKGGVPVSENVRFSYMNEGASLLINNHEIDPKMSYSIVTSDYLANGGDHMTFFKKGAQTENTTLLLRDAIINYCRELNATDSNIKSKIDERITIQ